MKKIYHQTQSLYKLERVSIIHKTKLSNRYVAKYILSWTFCGKERTIEKDRYGNYYLNGFMCNCLDILNYLQSPNQNDVEFGKIAAERRIDDNKKWFEGKTDDELEELKIKEEQIIKRQKKEFIADILSSMPLYILIGVAFFVILTILIYVWYWLCGGWSLFEIAESPMEFIVYLAVSVYLLIYLIRFIIK